MKKVSGQADYKGIISHLQIIRTWADVDRKYGGIKPECCEHIVTWIDDALELLKEQEPITPTVNEFGKAYCGNCGENVGIFGKTLNVCVRMRYCPECGKAVKWDE